MSASFLKQTGDAMSTVKQVLFTQLKSYFDKQKVSVCQKRIIQAPCFNEDGGLRGYMLITLDSFWTLLRSKSPFLMVSWYCQFLLSGLHARTGQIFSALGITRSIVVSMIHYLLVSTISLTLSILQWRRPAAMNRDSSLWEGDGHMLR